MEKEREGKKNVRNQLNKVYLLIETHTSKLTIKKKDIQNKERRLKVREGVRGGINKQEEQNLKASINSFGDLYWKSLAFVLVFNLVRKATVRSTTFAGKKQQSEKSNFSALTMFSSVSTKTSRVF